MTDYDDSGQESTDYEPTTKAQLRAQWEAFEFRVPAPGAVRVENASYGNESGEHVYVVSVEGGIPFDCTCPAWKYHNEDGGCKHMRAVADHPAVLLAASASNDEHATVANQASTGAVVATDGGAVVEGEENGDTDNKSTKSANDGQSRPQTDVWGNAVEHYDDEVHGAGEKRQCQACGSRFEIAMVAATADSSLPTWEEFYQCQNCGATGSFRFEDREHREARRTWTGMMDYPEEDR